MASKQAVLFIHGIGEQRPMDTLRDFVDTVWTRNVEIQRNPADRQLWSKPNTVSNSFELRRLSTPENTNGVQTDFFEFYWAHLMQGTKLAHVLGWARSLLIRRPSTVPDHLKLAYWVLIAASIVAVGFALYAAYPTGEGAEKLLPPWLSALVSVAILPVAGSILREIVGDAARYLHRAPGNIQRRHEIRQSGINVLNELHKRGYERIIVVGHSLGSVIGYDILTHAWPQYNTKFPASQDPPMTALDILEGRARGADNGTATTRTLQRSYFSELKENGSEWRVTDFVTMGCPLAHSEILLARHKDDLNQKILDREFPACLPVLETSNREGQEEQHFSFEPPWIPGATYRIPHHAAVFAPTRWTNLYFPSRFLVLGDLIGGPVSKILGSGISDVSVFTRQRYGFFSHTLYWKYSKGSKEAPPHIKALSDALDLLDQQAG